MRELVFERDDFFPRENIDKWTENVKCDKIMMLELCLKNKLIHNWTESHVGWEEKEACYWM